MPFTEEALKKHSRLATVIFCGKKTELRKKKEGRERGREGGRNARRYAEFFLQIIDSPQPARQSSLSPFYREED